MEDNPISKRSDIGTPQSNDILYKDKHVTIYRGHIIIHCYYFPIATSKIILFEDIKKFSIQEMTTFNGKYRLWGLNIQCLWFHLDALRFQKSKCIILDLGTCIKPAITPENVEIVYSILQANKQNDSINV